MTVTGIDHDSDDGVSADFATTASLGIGLGLDGGLDGGGPAPSMDGPAAACMMLLHPNRMAAKEEDGGSSSQVRMRFG